jgi:hypothetical protein
MPPHISLTRGKSSSFIALKSPSSRPNPLNFYHVIVADLKMPDRRVFSRRLDIGNVWKEYLTSSSSLALVRD